MIRMLSERQMRRRMGKSARQWKKLRKAERRGSTVTRAKDKRESRVAWLNRSVYTSVAIARSLGRRVRMLTPFFARQAHAGWDIVR